jgi:aminoglycoside phosphotransferase (APT) family kinase protein
MEKSLPMAGTKGKNATLIRSTPSPENLVERLLKSAGWPEAVQIQEFSGGRNNRVFRVETQQGECLLKVYFREPSDSRDRLGHEYGFLEACHGVGIDTLPKPLAKDSENSAALYEFIQGSRVEEVGSTEILQAAQFIEKINQHRGNKMFRALPHAAEACFSLQGHVASVDRRIDRLGQMESDSNLDRDARLWVEKELIPVWKKIREQIVREKDLEKELDQAMRILSPSDFGFHNSLRKGDGSLVFLDFEYAGWDDPAKLVCDLANQPDRPLSLAEAEPFSSSLVGWLGASDFLGARFRILAPLYQAKWACIILNDFLPFGRNRRKFQETQEPEASRKHGQLEKAKGMMSRVATQIMPL